MTITENIRAIVERAERERLEKLREIELERVFLRVRIRGYDADREKLASLDAEFAHLESQTGADIVREAVGAGFSAPTEDPFIPGLPPLRLREVWAEWEQERGPVYRFDGAGYQISTDPTRKWYAITGVWEAGYRPHGATWARVEAMADEAETAAEPKMLDLRTVRDDSNHTNPDVVMADADLFDAGETAATKAPLIRKGETFTVEREVSDHGKGPRVKVTREGQGQCYIAALQPAHVVPASPAPTLLDLTKLPPGTVCEAIEDIPRWNGRTVAAGVHFTLRDQSIVEGDQFPIIVTTNGWNAYCIPALVPARVVKEGGEQ